MSVVGQLVPLSPERIDDPGLAVGRGFPDVPWTIRQHDRIYNVLLAGGQGSGKSSMLLRIALGEVMAPNTATVILDMKGTLSERLLRLISPDIPKRWWDEQADCWQQGTKRLWYLDLGRPAFGLTPLRVEAGWSHTGLADEFARIADAVCRALLDLYPGQIMGSSEDLIERATVGAMAIAWWEHEQRSRRHGLDPVAHGFSGSFEVLAQMFAPSDRFDAEEAENRGRRRVRPNRWHQAAGRACQMLPNLDQVADTLLYEIPRQARDNLADIAKRMEAPANKIRPLVGAAASVRRFVGHPERLSLRSVIEAHDTLIINPRIELIGEDQASILTNFVVHMLDLQLKRQVASPSSRRPRVALVIDEAHRLITDTLITMVATHREAGLNVACALQYVSQLGADEPSAARREKIVKGVGNLLQSKVLFRMSDSEDADRHSQIFRSVYETMVRADPTSRARMPFDPARMQTLRDHHALVSLVSSAVDDHAGGLLDTRLGATRLPAFVTQTYAMPELGEIPDDWRRVHLDRQADVFRRYPEDMAALAVRDVPEGLAGRGPGTTAEVDPNEGARVAEETVGRRPDIALRDPPRRAKPETSGGAPTDSKRPERSEPPTSDQVGGVRIDRADAPDRSIPGSTAASPVLRFAAKPTDEPLPTADQAPATQAAQQAARAAATIEAITRLSAWRLAGEDAQTAARKTAEGEWERAFVEAQAAGRPREEARRFADQRSRRAIAQALERYADAAWRTPVKELQLSDAEAHTLEVVARLTVAAPKLLGLLLDEPATERATRERLAKLHDTALIARSDVGIEGRRGRPPHLYAIAPRGLEYLRQRRAQLAPDQEVPRYLHPDRKPPSPGRGRDIPHELAVQVTLVALTQYGGTATRLHWHTTRMPGGRWDVGMVHADSRDRVLRLADLLPARGVSVHGERLDAVATLEPDLSVQLQGPVDSQRAVIDLLLEIDRTGRGSYNEAKFVSYDHFLGGWCLRTRRFGHERRTRPIVVFVTQTPDAMLRLLHAADPAMTLGFAAPGSYDRSSFEYPGRAHTAFTCIEWLLAGQAFALRLPTLPPEVSGTETAMRPEHVALLPEEWWPRGAGRSARRSS